MERILSVLGLAACLAAGVVSCGQTAPPDRLSVTATTAMLGSICEAIGKDRVAVNTIVPAGMCPGHFDITAQGIKNLVDSRLVISHGWEQWVTRLLDAADWQPVLHSLDMAENMMVPPAHMAAAGRIAALLCSLDRAHEAYYMGNLRQYRTTVDSLTERARQDRERFGALRIACSELQSEFVEWLGFNVVVTFKRAEDLTPKMLKEVISQARNGGAALVIDNLQSGSDAGATVARELGVPHVVLTNFPLSGSYPDALRDNCAAILEAIR
ncbi:zinc ABC transporter substrate-binding protein [candidate division WOR-3 bacterium]|nr:zinc ABC transporter substrate-binding protein [candidate division WOR-3 bacterium]